MAKKRVATFREIYRNYLKKGTKLERYQKIGVGLLVVVIAGFIGWLYEVLLAWGETGTFYMRGGNFLPWINLYAIGALVVIPVTYRIRQKPWLTFIVSALVTGVIELVAGWLVYVTTDGGYLWNYDHGVWLIGSIHGFVCLLSVVIFGIFSVILVYLVVPAMIYWAKRLSRRRFLMIAVILFTLVMIDEVGNLGLRSAGLPSAIEFYKGLGMEY